MKSKIFWFVALLGLVFISRVLPHPANLSPVLALALIMGRTLNPWLGSVGLFAVLFLSDLFLGFDASQVYVYIGLATAILLGYRTRQVSSPLSLGGLSIAGSSVFFVISNFGHWLTTEMYSKTALGLVHCYIMALPFFWRSLAADFLFFGVFLVISKIVLGSSASPSQSHSAS